MLKKEVVVRGQPPIQPYLNCSFGETIYRKLLEKTGEDVALINGQSGDKLTFSELLTQTCSLGEALRNCGYGPKTVMSISSKNSMEYFHPLIASLFVGATIAPINFNYTATELTYMLNFYRPKVVFCSEALLDKYYSLKGEMLFLERIIVIDSVRSSDKGQCLKDFISTNLKVPVSRIETIQVDVEEDTALIMSSSGTTGLPKGVMLTHRNLNTVYSHFLDPRLHEQNYTSLCLLPFFHVYGIFTTISAMLITGSVVFLANFEERLFLKTIENYRINRLFLVPPLVIFLNKSPLIPEYDLSSIKEIMCAAAPLKESTEREVKKRLGLKSVRQGYGLTETTCAVLLSEKDESQWKPGSTGKATPYSEFAVRHPETGQFLGANECGEICVKGGMVMKGYFENPEATANTFTEDGWFRSGDIGYYDDEGNFYITDRIKELIKYKGYQVAPAELEALLLTHPDIVDIGVIGVEDEEAGELPLAFVVKTQKSALSEEDVKYYVQSKLSHPKWLRGGVIFIDKIPKTASGKILRKDLRKLRDAKK